MNSVRTTSLPPSGESKQLSADFLDEQSGMPVYSFVEQQRTGGAKARLQQRGGGWAENPLAEPPALVAGKVGGGKVRGGALTGYLRPGMPVIAIERQARPQSAPATRVAPRNTPSLVWGLGCF